MKFSVLYLPTYVPELDGPTPMLYGRMLDQIAAADELGYETVWLTEHHFHLYGGTVPNPAVLGAAIAARTRRIRIGTAVTVLPLHNPLIVAEDFAMLDVLSNGRLDFGVGRGSVPAEMREFGVSGEQSRQVLEEATDLILEAWSQESFEHRGQLYSHPLITMLPRPVQQPHPPIWVGAARTADTFEWAGRRGFHLMVLPYLIPREELREKIDVYLGALRAAGHDPANMEIMAKFHVFAAESMEAAVREASPAYDHYQRLSNLRSQHSAGYWRAGTTIEQHVAEYKVIAGTPEDCIERIRYWRDALGITQIAGTFHFGGLSQESTLRSLELFAREVAPAFASTERTTGASVATRG